MISASPMNIDSTKDSYEEVWTKCLKVIKDNIAVQAFKTWFEPIKAIKLEGKVLTIQVPSLFFYEWLEEHYVKLLHYTIKRELGSGAKLEYSIIVDNSSNGVKGTNSMRIPMTTNPRLEPMLEMPMPDKISGAIKNPFILPGLKKLNVDPQLNANLNFDNYVEGPCNRLARSAGMAVASKPGGTSFNPIFIYGNTGLGKTHLAQAIGNEIRSSYPNKTVLYVRADTFITQFVEAIKSGTPSDFTHFYQMIDVLILDDVHDLANKERTQEIFFQIFNHLHQNNKQIILTSDRPPKDIQGITDRLLSRFRWGLSADLHAPDYETRLAIVEKKLYNEGITLPKDVMEYVAYNITDSIRELEGAIISLIANSNLSRKNIDLPWAKEILKNSVKSKNKELSIEEIQKLVGDHFDVNVELLKAKTRKRHIVQARQICMYFSKNMTNSSLSRIGKYFGDRDHTTVIHACNTVQDLMDTDQKFRDKVNELEKLISINLK